MIHAETKKDPTLGAILALNRGRRRSNERSLRLNYKSGEESDKQAFRAIDAATRKRFQGNNGSVGCGDGNDGDGLVGQGQCYDGSVGQCGYDDGSVGHGQYGDGDGSVGHGQYGDGDGDGDGDGHGQPERRPQLLPPGWESYWDLNGCPYYYNPYTNHSQWEFPQIKATRHVNIQGYKRRLSNADMQDIVIRGDLEKIGIIPNDSADMPSWNEGRVGAGEEFWNMKEEMADLKTYISELGAERDESRMEEETLRNERDALRKELEQIRAYENRKRQRVDEGRRGERQSRRGRQSQWLEPKQQTATY